MSPRGKPEAAFQTGVTEFAGLNGWLFYHPPDNSPRQAASGRRYVQATQPGYPDLTMAHAQMRRIVIAELKAENGQTSPAQRIWLATLKAVASSISLVDAYGEPTHERGDPLEVYLWKPSDWDEIERVLTWDRS